jgi:hypothetical protein
MNNDRDDGQVFRFTRAELKATLEELVQPLEKKAFQAGKLAGLAEANELVRLEAMVKVARQAGLTSTANASVGTVGKTPEELAKRATELQVQALRNGRELSNIESVKAAYAEAGIALK